MFILFLSIIQAILFLLHFVVYEVFIYYIAPNFSALPGHLNWIRTFFLITSLLFLGSTVLTYQFYSQIGKFFYRIASVWLGTIYFFFIASMIVALLRPSSEIAGIIFMMAALISIGSVINGFTVRIKKVEIELSYLPEAWKGRRAIMFGDTHVGNMRGKKFIKKLTDLIISLKPDIVLITGDIFDGPPIKYDQIISPLSALSDIKNIPLGAYFVTGNHEEFDDPSLFIHAVRSTGIKILDNQAENIEGVTFVGVDHRATVEKEEYEMILEAALGGVDKQTPIILLKHVPSNIDVALKNSIDLSLHGHTHNAQMWPLTYLAKKMFKGYEYGLKKYKDMHVLTTSGAGTFGPPQRFFTQTEIVEIVFK